MGYSRGGFELRVCGWALPLEGDDGCGKEQEVIGGNRRWGLCKEMMRIDVFVG